MKRQGSGSPARIFGFVETPRTWGELVSNVTEDPEEAVWIHELCRALRAAASKKIVAPIHASFSAINSGKSYRPVVYSIEIPRDGSRARSFKILFLEEVSAGLNDHFYVPRELSVLATVLRLSYRFQWEVLERFRGRELETEDLRKLEDTLERLNTEATTRGFTDPELLFCQFRPENAAKIRTYFDYWHRAARQATRSACSGARRASYGSPGCEPWVGTGGLLVPAAARLRAWRGGRRKRPSSPRRRTHRWTEPKRSPD